MKSSIVLGLVSACLLSIPAMAQSSNDSPQRHKRQLPPAAFEACDGKAEGDSCSAELPRGTFKGICKSHRRSEKLVCAPHHHRQHRRKMIKAAIAACEGKAQGDLCSMNLPQRTLEGTCKTHPRFDKVFCAPNHRPE